MDDDASQPSIARNGMAYNAEQIDTPARSPRDARANKVLKRAATRIDRRNWRRAIRNGDDDSVQTSRRSRRYDGWAS